MTSSMEPYAAIGVTIGIVVVVVAGQLVLAHLIGPRIHRGPVKDRPYESGMPIVMDTRRRFNVRFYLVALLFLLFDVELIFIWPWAQLYHKACTTGYRIPLDGGGEVGGGFLAAGMGFFVAMLVFGLLYEWKRGALQWD